MRHLMLAAVAALALSGCSSFRMGAVCYLPAGQVGTCEMQVVPALAKPSAPAAPAAKKPDA